jgi:metalloendopeptidase OMA1, mitochondrial
MKKTIQVLVVLAAAVTGLLSTGCYTVPETGRQAFILPLGDDVTDGQAAFLQIKGSEKVSSDPQYNERVSRIGRRIADVVANDLPTAQWEFVVFDAPENVNAFALPGGKVGVYTGLLKLVESDDELAMVMGHEIAHVTARHGAQRRSEILVAGALGEILNASMQESGKQDAVMVGYGMIAAGVTLKFSREHETEADYIGLRYAARAGYDPRAALIFWQKMLKGEKGTTIFTFLRTHPPTEQRIEDIRGNLPALLPIYEEARKRFPSK